MSKFFSLFLLFLLFSIIYTQENETDVINGTEDENNTNSSFDDMSYEETDIFDHSDYGNIIWVDDSNYTTLEQYDFVFVLFYAPWCGHCERFIPKYINISKYCEAKNYKLKFAKCNGSNSPNASLEFDVNGYPSIYLMIKGKKFLYEGERDQEGMIKFYNRKLNDDVFKVETLSQIDEYIKSNQTVVLSTIKDTESPIYKSYANASKENLNIDFISCITPECIKEYSEDIILFKNFDEKINKFSKDFMPLDKAELNSVGEFIGTYSVEAGGILKVFPIAMMLKYRRKMMFYFRNSSIPEQTKYDSVIKQLGKDFRNKKIYTCVADIEGDELSMNIAESFVVIKEDLPAILFFDLRENQAETDLSSIFSMRAMTKEQITLENLKDFTEKVLTKKIKKDLYSELPMDDYFIDGLKYVIGRTYDSAVIEEKKNVLICLTDELFFCPNCVNMLDILRNLTKIYPPEEYNLVYAYSNSAKNQPRDIKVEGREPPMLFLYTNAMDNKDRIEFKSKNISEVTIDEVEDFLVENLKWTKKERKATEERAKEEKAKEDNAKEEETKEEKIKEEKIKKEIEKDESKKEEKETQTDL